MLDVGSRMNQLDTLKEVIEYDRTVRLVEENIYSVLPAIQQTYQYDKKAAIYDFVVGSSLYNRVMWGDSPTNYMAFARRAIKSHPNGWLMEAGCGSMLFTAEAYLESQRPIIACDQSLNMLRRARARLAKSANSIPEHIFLVQADLSDIPFRAVSFQTVLSMNVLHHYADIADLVLKLKNLLTESGSIYLTSLVTNNRFPGDRYLSALHNKGWLVHPRTKDELKNLLQQSLRTEMRFWMEGNMAYATNGVLSS
jgi:ubiquinone/menaquinone biosynthesis C-methylase UbiE